jgi:hypothetical protein
MHQKYQRIFDKCLWKNLHLGFFCNNTLTPFLAAAQNHCKVWLAISLLWRDFKP